MSNENSYVPRALSGRSGPEGARRSIIPLARVPSANASVPGTSAPDTNPSIQEPKRRIVSAGRQCTSSSLSTASTNPSTANAGTDQARPTPLDTSEQDRRRAELRSFLDTMETRPDPLADVDLSTLKNEPSEVFEQKMTEITREQNKRRDELRTYLATLQRKTESDSAAAPLVEFPATFGALVAEMIKQYRSKGFSGLPTAQTLHRTASVNDGAGPSVSGRPAPSSNRSVVSTAVTAASKATSDAAAPYVPSDPTEHPGLAWIMDPALREGLEAIRELDKKLETIGALEGGDDGASTVTTSNRPGSRASRRGPDDGLDATSIAPSAAVSALSTASRFKLRPVEEEWVERIAAMTDEELEDYLGDPYDIPLTAHAQATMPGGAQGVLSLADINQRMLEYSAAHGWAWEAETEDRVAMWVGGTQGGSGPVPRPSTGMSSVSFRMPMGPSFPPATPSVRSAAIGGGRVSGAPPSIASRQQDPPATPSVRAPSRAGSVRRADSMSERGGAASPAPSSVKGGKGAPRSPSVGSGAADKEEEVSMRPTADYLREQREMREMQQRQHEIDIKLMELKSGPAAPAAVSSTRSLITREELAELLEESRREMEAVEHFRRRISNLDGRGFSPLPPVTEGPSDIWTLHEEGSMDAFAQPSVSRPVSVQSGRRASNVSAAPATPLTGNPSALRPISSNNLTPANLVPVSNMMAPSAARAASGRTRPSSVGVNLNFGAAVPGDGSRPASRQKQASSDATFISNGIVHT